MSQRSCVVYEGGPRDPGQSCYTPFPTKRAAQIMGHAFFEELTAKFWPTHPILPVRLFGLLEALTVKVTCTGMILNPISFRDVIQSPTYFKFHCRVQREAERVGAHFMRIQSSPACCLCSDPGITTATVPPSPPFTMIYLTLLKWSRTSQISYTVRTVQPFKHWCISSIYFLAQHLWGLSTTWLKGTS